MQDRVSNGEEGLTLDELEVALRALGTFQIGLYDKLEKCPESSDSVQAEIKVTSACIKKVHKMHEKLKGKVT
jgi:hypothetical protein